VPIRVLYQGRYELFETIHHHRILVLDGRRWFARIEGQLGELLVRTGPNHVKDHTIQSGQFFLVDVEDDRKFKDMPHLFLQRGDEYQELLLPDGLPTDDDPQTASAESRAAYTLALRGADGEQPRPGGPCVRRRRWAPFAADSRSTSAQFAAHRVRR
jgi:hypothetical protein